MKWLKKSPLLWLLLGTILILTFVSVISRNVYEDYPVNLEKEPYLSVLFQGMEKGVLPFHLEKHLETKADSDSFPTAGFDDFTEDLTEGGISANELVQAVQDGNLGDNPADTGEQEKSYEYQSVTTDYFDDAVFIGDSRTDGLARYSGLANATFYAKTSLTVYDFFTKHFIPSENPEEKEKLTVEEALSRKQFKKVYIMLGINELGIGGPEYFGAAYLKVLTRIRQLQPDAIIFVQGIMRVTEEKSAIDPVYNNNSINVRNALVSTIDNHHDVFYLEINDAVCDETGALNPEYTFDDVHLKARFYYLWVNYLLEHGIVKDSAS